ncbi:hypothetical protein AWB76_07683 [Caballeronia temeraria]|uniref:Uncharacterized protein n=1 Tax=Caballeronia temeraria TaxID=1777137 RepID=A0A158DXC0_9BURK|nr:hypothetical protein [Caballeronia temeraria]SAK99252.1 hypothetical protein AWB76_07683 [Caballeronia temeraria]
MLKQRVNVFIAGEALLAAKKEVVNRCVEKAQSDGSSVAAAEKSGARVFLAFARTCYGFSEATTAQYLRVYQRFVSSRHRSEMEALFNAGELAVLAAYSDDELTEIVSAKAANPSLTRDGIKQLLKTRRAA